MMRRPLSANLVTDFSLMWPRSSSLDLDCVMIFDGVRSELEARIPLVPRNFEADAAVVVPAIVPPNELFWTILFYATAFLRA